MVVDKVVLDGVVDKEFERWWLTKTVEKDGLWEMVCERWCVKDGV